MRVSTSKKAVVLALCALSAACSHAMFGNSDGEYESLELEAAAQLEYLTGIVDTAVPVHEIVSTRVNVGPCEPEGGWKVGTSLVVTTGDVHPSDALEQLVAVLETDGATVESWVDSTNWSGVDYAADQGRFGGRLTLLWSTKPVLRSR